jgi:hypothetical protein
MSDSDVDSLDSDDDISVCTEEVNTGVKRNILMQIEQFSVDSSRSSGYEIVRNSVGDRVYSDRGLKWTHLPEQLKLQLCIRTPCDDMYVRCKQLFQFTVNRPCLVMVLVDMRSVKGHLSTPKWLKEDGFKKVGDQAIARVVQNGVLLESFYGIFGKYFGRGEVVLEQGIAYYVSDTDKPGSGLISFIISCTLHLEPSKVLFVLLVISVLN